MAENPHERVKELVEMFEKKYRRLYGNDVSLKPIKDFSEDVLKRLRQSRLEGDRDEMASVLIAASTIFRTLDDDRKSNLFIYLLGRNNRRR